jgi:nitroimidazol reductase NimA-like FMN-containing flavoprotein (pyridoxamine 5'-phosphate oxidase superfamily)
VVPVSYAYDGSFFYLISKEGMKVNMMRKNPKVCIQIDDMHNMSGWQSAILWGEFEELTESKDRNHALHLLTHRMTPVFSSEMFRITPYWPFPEEQVDQIPGIVYRIRITEKTGRFESYAMSNVFDY